MEKEPVFSGAPGGEALVAEWQEAEREAIRLPLPPSLLVGGGTFLAILCVGMGYRLKEFNFYLVAVVIFLAVLTIAAQSRRTSPSLPITLTTLRLIVGERQYPLAELAGFWIGRDGTAVTINVETKKTGVIPISFLYGSSSENEARQTMNQVLAELEPRTPTAADRLNRYFRL